MPVFRCSGGKYRIGGGRCRYRTRFAAEKAYRAYLSYLSRHSSRKSGVRR